MFSLYHQIRAPWLKVIVSGFGLVFIFTARASTHEGPPYPIIVDRMAGPYLVSVWADPDVGRGTFFVILEPPEASPLPEDIKVELRVQPINGRLAEAHYIAARDGVRRRVQYKAEVPFDREERWRVGLTLRSSQGSGEITTEVEVTPPGYGRWDLLIYLFPFAAIGILWLRAVLHGHSRKRHASGL
jgi:hypothetical protein